jgi:hypothetical protein
VKSHNVCSKRNDLKNPHWLKETALSKSVKKLQIEEDSTQRDVDLKRVILDDCEQLWVT